MHRLSAWVILMTLNENEIEWAQPLFDSNLLRYEKEQINLLEIALNHRDGLSTFSQFFYKLPQISLSNFWNNPSKVSSFANQIDNVQKPIWLDGIMEFDPEIRFGKGIKVQLLEMDLKKFHFGIVKMSDKNLNTLIKIKSLPNPNSSWLQLLSVGRFIERPSKETLAHELRQLAQYFNSQHNSFIYRSMSMPWPMGACFSAASNKDELLKHADRAEAGELGDFRDWETAEERWDKDGVVYADFLYMNEQNWPFE